MDYYIEEDKTFDEIIGIKSAEVKCTLSNGETLLFKIPNITAGSFVYKGDEIVFNNNRFLRYVVERVNQHVCFNFPVTCDKNGIICTMEKFDK